MIDFPSRSHYNNVYYKYGDAIMETSAQKNNVVLSFVQSSGTPTVGNYFGAFKNWHDMAVENDCIFGVADLHAITRSEEAHV